MTEIEYDFPLHTRKRKDWTEKNSLDSTLTPNDFISSFAYAWLLLFSISSWCVDWGVMVKNKDIQLLFFDSRLWKGENPLIFRITVPLLSYLLSAMHLLAFLFWVLSGCEVRSLVSLWSKVRGVYMFVFSWSKVVSLRLWRLRGIEESEIVRVVKRVMKVLEIVWTKEGVEGLCDF